MNNMPLRLQKQNIFRIISQNIHSPKMLLNLFPDPTPTVCENCLKFLWIKLKEYDCVFFSCISQQFGVNSPTLEAHFVHIVVASPHVLLDTLDIICPSLLSVIKQEFDQWNSSILF